MRSDRPVRVPFVLPIVTVALLAGQAGPPQASTVLSMLEAQGIMQGVHRWPSSADDTVLPALNREARMALEGADYVMVTVPESWTASAAQTALFQRQHGEWVMIDGPHLSNVGGKGVSWGRGLTSPPLGQSVKREGDRTAPAGLFRLGQAFGRSEPPPQLSLPYHQTNSRSHCVDDARAAEYGRIVELAPGQSPRWTSSENLGSDIAQNELFVLIGHNGLVGGPAPTPGGGSCIFLHGGAGPGGSTLGCTALDTGVLRAMLGRISAQGGQPPETLYVLLPRDAYRAAVVAWGLPELSRRD